MTQFDQEIADLSDAVQKKLGLKNFRAVLGDETGRVFEPGRIGYVRVRYVTASGFSPYVVVRFRVSINPIVGTEVLVGYDEEGELAVLKLGFSGLIAQGTDPTSSNPADPNNSFWIAQYRLLTAASHPVSSSSVSMLVTVHEWLVILDGTVYYFAGDQVDLTSFIPGSSDEWGIACIFWKTDNTLETFASTPKSSPDDLGIDDVQECMDARSAGSLPIWAWRLFNGQTGISPGAVQVGGDDFLDLRQFINVVDSSGSGGMTSFDVAADSGTPATIEDGETVTHAGGTGLTSVISGNTVTTNLDTPVALAHGGTHADLSATGGANQFVKQSSAGAAFTVGTIADADVPDALTISGGTVDNTPIGATTASTAIVSALSLLIGGFKAIFTHANSADRTYTLPNATTTLVGTDVSQVLTSKTIGGDDNTVQDLPLTAIKTNASNTKRFITRDASGVITDATSPAFDNANHSHQNSAGGGTLDAAAIAAGQLALARGGTHADLSGAGAGYLRQATSGADVTVKQPFDYVLIRDEKTQNTNGGNFTSGSWQTRTLNTEVSDAGGRASISSNQVTLDAGTWRIRAHAPAFSCARHQIRWQNISDATTTAIGTSEDAVAATSQSRSFIDNRFTIAAQKTFELQHQCQTTRNTDGFGVAANFTTEVYAVVELWMEN